MNTPESSEQSVAILITNERAATVNFVLEMWGEVYPMAAGDSFTVTMIGELIDLPQLVIGDDNVTLYVPRGMTANVLCNGITLGPGSAKRPSF
jgi:hypothetical protein